MSLSGSPLSDKSTIRIAGLALTDNDCMALRSPPFARGYVKAYGRLLGIDENQLLTAFDSLPQQQPPGEKKRVETRPLQLQHTGVGVVIGLAVLGVLMLGLWLWQGDDKAERGIALPASAEVKEERPPGPAAAGES